MIILIDGYTKYEQTYHINRRDFSKLTYPTKFDTRTGRLI